MCDTRKLILEKIDTTLPDPSYAHDTDAGIDLYARERVILDPLTRAVIPLGVRCKFPEGTFGMVVCKSGLALKGLSQVNCCGIIDQDYRGEINFIAYNSDKDEAIVIEKGQKCCQMILMDLPKTELVFEEVNTTETERGEGGFGSTGLD